MTIGLPGETRYCCLPIICSHLRREAYMPSVKAIARSVIGLYNLFTIAALITYKLCSLDFFDALIYALTTISTGGFTAINVFPRTMIWPTIVLYVL